MTDKINIITANRLDNGLVVYFQSVGQWTDDLQSASQFADGEMEDAMVEAKKDSKARLVVSIYDFPAKLDGKKIIALSAREEIRALHKPTIGPSA